MTRFASRMKADPPRARRSWPLVLCAILVAAPVVSLFVSPASAAINWDSLPAYAIRTSQGPFIVEFTLQLARNETDLWFRAWFDYPEVPADPDRVYFAVEFDLSGRGEPMAAGDEMIIVSREDPSGGIAAHFSYFVEQTERSPVPAPANIVILDSYEMSGPFYRFEFHRPLRSEDTVHHQQFSTNTSVYAAFAVGEWGIGQAHSYTTMSYLLTVSETEVHLSRPSGVPFSFALTRDAANLLGQGIVLLTFALMGVHIVRRRIWSKEYHPRERTSQTVEMTRHSLAARATHMVHLVLLVVFIATGASLLLARPILGPWTLAVHVAAAFVVVVNLPLHIAAVVAAGEKDTLVLIKRDDLATALKLSLNFLGLSKEFPEHVTYEPGKDEYYMGRKYCAFQKFLFWGDTLFLTIMILTGFALYYPGSLGGLRAALGGREAVLALHDLFFYLLTATVMGHLYFSLIPANWPRLRSIVSGKAKVPVHPSSSPGASPERIQSPRETELSRV